MTEARRAQGRSDVSSIQRPPVAMPLAPARGLHHGAIVLQRTAGNRAVAGMLGPRPLVLQRALRTKPSDLDKFISAGDLVKGRLGRASDRTKTFSAIRGALDEYRAAQKKRTSDPEPQARRLAILDALCTRFLEENPQDKARRPIVDRLLGDVADERRVVSRAQAQQVYERDIENSTPESVPFPKAAPGPRKPGWQRTADADPTKKFALAALSATGKAGATNWDVGSDRNRRQRIEEEKAKYGLTGAEISAIWIFSAGDFTYINPATANSQSWLGAQKDQLKGKERFANMTGERGNRTIMEEGSLHTAVALQGLAKMERFKGETYRGARLTPEQFADKFQQGKKTSFTTLTSSTFDKEVALDFVFGSGSGTKPRAEQSVAILSIFTDSGGVDISNIAMIKGESEVVIMPGSVFEVKSLEEVDPTATYGKWMQAATVSGVPVPTRFFVARLSPTSATPAPEKPERKFQTASATGPKLPMSTPIEEYLRLAGRPARGMVGGHR